MTDYKNIAARLRRVRWAWKRTAALTGLAVTVLEATGMFTVALVVDLLFRPGQQGRLALLGIVAATVGVQLARHVLRPLFRRISDQQLALHIEEHNPGFEGALIAATEFGRQPDGGVSDEIIGTILAEAECRASRLDLRRVTDLVNLRKYGWLATAAVLVYGGMSVLFPNTVGRHAQRVAAPWRTPDPVASAEPAEPPKPPPLAFTLSETNANVLRGAAFRLETALSRTPETPVHIHFRSFAASTAEARWYALPMKGIEKVYAYEAVLPDVNEDMECYVSAEGGRSATCQIRVYDPLAVDAIETVIRYPAYLARPDRVSRQPNGDLAAPLGATATIRVLANRPIVSGRLAWSDAGPQPLVPGASAEAASASASFAVTTNRAYRFHVEDNMGQVFESPSESYVKALPDTPPAIVLKRPSPPPDSVTPLSELTIEAVAADDFGLAGVDFVYRCSGETEGPELRVPLSIGTNAVSDNAETPVAFLLALETLSPALRGGDVIAWHLEARDRKQQTAVTDLVLTPVRHFDLWPTEMFAAEEELQEEEPPSLAAILQSAFQLAAHRAQLAPREFDRQTDDLAKTMVNPKTKAVWTFAKVKPSTPPEDVEKIKRINAWAAEGHAHLGARAVAPAVESLRRAVTLMIAMGLLKDPMLERLPPQASAVQPSANNQTKQQLEAMAAVERKTAQEAQKAPKEKQLAQADKTEELQKKLAELAAQQKKRADEARELEKNAAESPPQTGARKQAAEAQQQLADTVKAEASTVEKDRALDEAQRQRTAQALRDAARQMDQATHEMQQGRVEKAAQAAETALQRLTTARDELDTSTQDKLAQALAKAEKQAEKALRKQTETAAATDAAAQQQRANPPAAQRQMKELAVRQALLKTDLDDLQSAVTTLNQAVESGAVKPETAKHIQAAERELRRGRPAQKAANAVVALTAQNGDEALAAQKQAADALAKAHASLRQASDSTATGYEAELKRARNEAEQSERHVQQLHRAESPQDRSAQAEEALDTAARLARHIQSRDFVAAPTAQALSEQLPKTPAEAGRVEADKEKALALASAISKVRAELDEAYAKLQENKRLFSSQREECPPQYRPLVNTYFEALSGGNQPR